MTGFIGITYSIGDLSSDAMLYLVITQFVIPKHIEVKIVVTQKHTNKESVYDHHRFLSSLKNTYY